MVTPVMCAHYLTAGIKFTWSTTYHAYIADDPQWLVLLYKWTVEWVDKIQRILVELGMWDRHACLIMLASVHSCVRVNGCNFVIVR